MNQEKYQTIFFGTPDFAVPVLKTILTLPYLDLVAVVTQPDKEVGRKQILTPSPVKKLALENKIPILQPEKIKTKVFEEVLFKLNPAVILLVAYGKIIPSNLIGIPKFGWLNVHGSLLPKYRGASPIQAAILNDDKETGVTLIKIDKGLDTGPIISQKKMGIKPDDNFQTLHDKLTNLGALLVKESLLDYLEGKISPTPQDDSKASLTKIIRKEDGRIDWTKPAEEIERQIRAYHPWPGAFSFWNGKRLKILKAAFFYNQTVLEVGKIKKIDRIIIVGCGKGNLELKKIQLEGKKPQSISEFLIGHPEFTKSKIV